MNKTNKLLIIKIVLLAIIAVLLFTIMFILLKKENALSSDFTSTNKIVYENTFSSSEINNIKINGLSTDIRIEAIESDQIEVSVQAQKENTVTVSNDNNTLEITKNKTRDICIGFCFSEDLIVVGVPKNYSQTLELKTSSGDIKVGYLPNLTAKIITTSGDAEILSATNIDIKTTSGDITVKYASNLKCSSTSGELELGTITESINLKTTSGDIELDNLTLKRNGIIKTVSGEVEINSLKDIYVETETISGREYIEQNNRYAKNELKIKTTSGDITVGED